MPRKKPVPETQTITLPLSALMLPEDAAAQSARIEEGRLVLEVTGAPGDLVAEVIRARYRGDVVQRVVYRPGDRTPEPSVRLDAEIAHTADDMAEKAAESDTKTP